MAARRILVVVTSTARRGAEIEGVALADWWAAHGIEAQAVALAASSGDHPLPIDTLGPGPRRPTTLAALRRRAAGVDLVLAYGSATLPACSLALGRAVPWVYRSIGDPAAWCGGRVRRWRTTALLRRSRGVVALWPGGSEAVGRLYRMPAEQRWVIPNARDHARFSRVTGAERTAARAQLGVAADAPVVAYLGSLSDDKRPLLTVDAVAASPGVHLLVAGEGPLLAEVAVAAARVPDGRVHVLGELTDVRSVYAAADAVVLTSRTEGMPGVLIEAAMSGLPVVAADVGAIGWMFDQGLRGELVPPGAAPADIARSIERVLTDRPSPIGVPFGWDTVGPQWTQVVDEVLSPARRA